MYASVSIEWNSVEIIVCGWVIVQFLSLLGRRARLSLPAALMAEWEL
jgi:hypothetical protein